MRFCICFIGHRYRQRCVFSFLRKCSKLLVIFAVSILTAKLLHYIWTEPLIFVTLNRELLEKKFPVPENALANANFTTYSSNETPVIGKSGSKSWQEMREISCTLNCF